MKRVVAVMAMMASFYGGPAALAFADGNPQYFDCPGGYIVPLGRACPPFQTPISIHPGTPAPVGGGAGGGLLGTVGRILGGLTGGIL